MPYWDWTFDAPDGHLAPVWKPNKFGGDGKNKCVDFSKSPLAGWYAIANDSFTPACVIRGFGACIPNSIKNAVAKREGWMNLQNRTMVATRLAKMKTLPDCGEIRLIHDCVHFSIDGTMYGYGGPGDPIFPALHSYTEKWYSEWEDSHPTEKFKYKGGKFRDTDMLPYIPGFKGFQVRDALDYHRFCYTYSPQPEISDEFAVGLLSSKPTISTPSSCNSMAEDLRSMPPPLIEYLLPLRRNDRPSIETALQFLLREPFPQEPSVVCLPSEEMNYQRLKAARSQQPTPPQQHKPPQPPQQSHYTNPQLKATTNRQLTGLDFALWTALVVESYDPQCSEILRGKEGSILERGFLVEKVVSDLFDGYSTRTDSLEMFDELASMFLRRDSMKGSQFFDVGVRMRDYLKALIHK